MLARFRQKTPGWLGKGKKKPKTTTWLGLAWEKIMLWVKIMTCSNASDGNPIVPVTSYVLVYLLKSNKNHFWAKKDTNPALWRKSPVKDPSNNPTNRLTWTSLALLVRTSSGFTLSGPEQALAYNLTASSSSCAATTDPDLCKGSVFIPDHNSVAKGCSSVLGNSQSIYDVESASLKVRYFNSLDRNNQSLSKWTDVSRTQLAHKRLIGGYSTWWLSLFLSLHFPLSIAEYVLLFDRKTHFQA